MIMKLKFKTVKYLPWVGEHYHDQPVRILILGVKCYSEDPLAVPADVCTEVVRSHIESAGVETYHDFFDRVVGLFIRCGETAADVWQRVSFYNYTQTVLPGTDSFPTYEQILASEPAYLEVLDALRPHKVVILGQRLYNNVLCCKGCEAQRIEGHETWMLDLHQVIGSVPEADHIVHSTFVNDPSNVHFEVPLWRRTVDDFLALVPEEYKTPQIKRRVMRILDFMHIRYDDLLSPQGFDLPGVLAKAIARGLIRFEPEVAIVDAQCFRAESQMATIYFASKLRDAFCEKTPDDAETEQKMLAVVRRLLKSDRFLMEFSGNGLLVIGSKRKTEVRRLYDDMTALRTKEKRVKKISWLDLEKMFKVSYMRQNLKCVRPERDYVSEIDVFFRKSV